MYATFGDPKSRNRDLGIQIPRKKASFGSKIYEFSYNLKTDGRVMLKFERSIGENGGLVEFGGARSHNRNFRCQKSTKSGQI